MYLLKKNFFKQASFVFAISLLLVSCDNKPENTNVRTEETRSRAKADIKIILYTDLVEKSEESVEYTYPKILEQELENAYDGYNIDVALYGDYNSRIKKNLQYKDSIKFLNPDIVLVALGTHDGLARHDVKKIRSDIDQIVRELKVNKQKIILAGMRIPSNLFATDNRRRGSFVNKKSYYQQFISIYPDIAKRYSVNYMPYIYRGLTNNSEYLGTKNIYLTKQGHKQLAVNLVPYFKKIIDKMFESEKISE